jgi:signal transduction histidine kinase
MLSERPIQILLVEDNPGDADLVRERLCEAGEPAIEITYAEHLREALRLAARRSFDVILLDLSLPDATGLETLRRMHEGAAGAPIVVLTGLDNDDVGLEAVREGAQDYVVKSQAGGQLLRSVRYAIERGRLEAQLRQSQKLEAVGRLAGGMAHNLNNLMTAVLGYSDLLIDLLPADGPSRQYVEEIKQAGGRAASLTSQLLSFSRRQILCPCLLDLNTVIVSAATSIRTSLGDSIRFTVDSDPGLFRVKADPGHLKQVLLTLAANARDSMPDGGDLHIQTANLELDENSARGQFELAPGRYASLSVTDTGRGMDEETKHRLFEPFFTTKGLVEGSGLGLAGVYGLIKQSDGHIAVHSEPGAGTRFVIYLPAAEGRESTPCR